MVLFPHRYMHIDPVMKLDPSLNHECKHKPRTLPPPLKYPPVARVPGGTMAKWRSPPPPPWVSNGWSAELDVPAIDDSSHCSQQVLRRFAMCTGFCQAAVPVLPPLFSCRPSLWGGGGIARVFQGTLWYPPLMQANRTQVKRLLH